MAGTEEKKTDVKTVDTKQVEKPKVAYEPTYTVEELLQAVEEFKTTRIVVRAALKQAGKTEYTMKEAKQLIVRMKSKEVKE